jgi:hypothetical protein
MRSSISASSAFALLVLLAACGGTSSSSEPPLAEKPFNPISDVALPGGSYSYTQLTIPAGVTVNVQDEATFAVLGSIAHTTRWHLRAP